MAKKFQRTGDPIVSRRIAGETLLVPIKGKLVDLRRIYALNPVGEFVWQRLAGEPSVDELRESIVAHFAVDSATAERDLLGFLGELADEGLIEERG